MMTPIDFDGINAAALCNGRSFVESLLPGGKFRSLEYVVKNPCRDDRRPGSFSVNYRSGRWKDFASGDGGADPISLVAYVRGVNQGDAARELADNLGVPLLKANGSAKPNGSLDNGHHNETSQATEAPKVYSWGNEGPPVQPDEIRRHVYSCGGCAKRIKIKVRKNANPWVQCFRIFRNGAPIGWQWTKPDDYTVIPYVSSALDPFDPELVADDVLWPEGEKDVDSLGAVNLPGFTFGGVGDGLPEGIGQYLKDRRLVILADNDDAGHKHAEKKAALAHKAGAASIRVVHFPELPPKGDVSDFVACGGTPEQLAARIDTTPTWSPRATTSEIEQEALVSRKKGFLLSRCAAEIPTATVPEMTKMRL